MDKNHKVTKLELIALANKYGVITSGSKAQLAKSLCDLRGSYLTKKERELIIPLLNKNHISTKIFLDLYNKGIYKKLPS